jgi:hypothetical protein
LKPSTNHTNQQQTHNFDKIQLKIGHGSHTCVHEIWCQGPFFIFKAIQGHCAPKCTKTSQGWCYPVYGCDQPIYNISGEW